MFSKTDKDRSSAKNAQSGATAPSIISASLHIVGNLKTEGEVQVDGVIDGDVTSRALTVGENARVKGEVIAEEIIIRGSIEGRVRAKSVRLAKTAHVVGDIVHEILSVEPGAYIEGQLRRADNAKRAAKRGDFAKSSPDDADAKATDVPAAPLAEVKSDNKESLKAVGS